MLEVVRISLTSWIFDYKVILGRHFGCRPLDPTLDIWSDNVKKKKKKKSILPPFLKQGFPRVTKGTITIGHMRNNWVLCYCKQCEFRMSFFEANFFLKL